MKSKSTERSATPALWANDLDWEEPAEKLPVFLKPFTNVKTTAEFLEKFIERQKVERMAGFAYGLADLGTPLPEWTKNASRQFWKNYVGDTPLNPMKSVEDFGVMVKLVEVLSLDFSVKPRSLVRWPKLEKFLNSIGRKIISLWMDKLISRLSDAEKSQSYAGRARAEQIMEKFSNPTYLAMIKRAKVYLAITITWREIEQLATNAEREQWLRIMLTEFEAKKPTKHSENGDASKDIQFSKTPLSSREYYDVFQTIGLEGAPPGRPKKSKTRAGEIAKS